MNTTNPSAIVADGFLLRASVNLATMDEADTTYQDVCPLCGGILSLSGHEPEVICPHCENLLLTSLCDPAGHYVSEIDPECGDGGAGVLRCELHPVGTRLCWHCALVYPCSFSCCPGLVELAISSLGVSEEWHGPKTQARLAEFLRDHRDVVKNVAERARLRHLGDLLTFEHVEAALTTAGLAEYLSGGEQT